MGVCLERDFPVFVLERSPLVLRDLDLLQAIDERAVAVVVFSIIYTPDSRHADRVRQMERLAPPSAEALCGDGAVGPYWDPDRDLHDAHSARVL